MERNILLTLEYDGTGLCGWQRQPGLMTVQGEVEKALSEITGKSIRIDGVSRTDAGVHALGQRASFSGDFGIPTHRIAKALNDKLASGTKPGAIRVVSAEERPAGFHARFDSKGKKYRYLIRNAGEMSPFERNFKYLVRNELDVRSMQEAADHIKGTHDFACFQAAGGTLRETTVRTVTDIGVAVIEEDDIGRDIALEISGDGFLYNMVRIITGTLVEVGAGKIAPEEMKDIIESCDRARAGHTAPPQGLYLVEVYY